MKKIYFFLWGLCGMYISANAQDALSLVIWQKDGSKVSYGLSEVRRMTISPTELRLVGTGMPYALPTERFRKITFQNEIGADLTSATTEMLPIVYPNPIGNLLFIKGNVATDLPLTIYSVSGEVCLTGVYRENGVDVSVLLPGFYLLQIGNHVLKIRKL